MSEIEQHHSVGPTPAGSPKRTPLSFNMTPHSPTDAPPPSPPKRDPRQLALSKALLTSVATNNITTLQQGLAKLTNYWSGVAWVAGALTQRIQGIKAQDVDLVNVTETLGSYVSLPDAGSVPRHTVKGNVDSGITPRTWDTLMNTNGSDGIGESSFRDMRSLLMSSRHGLLIVTFRAWCDRGREPKRNRAGYTPYNPSGLNGSDNSGMDFGTTVVEYMQL
jgi:hypothetical protein